MSSTFNELIQFIRAEVNQGLQKLQIPEIPSYLYDPIRYTLEGKGKRFRPILVYLSSRANHADPESCMKIALAVELLHNFTLIHDDIMDNDHTRHGQATIHNKWDISTAILAGDGIYAISQILLNRLPDRVDAICHYFNKATLEVCEGQAMDKEFENDLSINENQYLIPVIDYNLSKVYIELGMNENAKNLLGGDLEIDSNRNQGNLNLIDDVKDFATVSQMIEISTMLSTINRIKIYTCIIIYT